MSRQMEVGAVLERRGCNCGWWSEGELSDLDCGLHRPREYAALFSWHPLETCCLPGARGKSTEPRPERGGQNNHNISDINKHPDTLSVYECGKCSCHYNECNLLVKHKKWSHLSEKCDWFLAHGVGVAYVSLDDFRERFLDSLKR